MVPPVSKQAGSERESLHHYWAFRARHKDNKTARHPNEIASWTKPPKNKDHTALKWLPVSTGWILVDATDARIGTSQKGRG